MGPSLSIHLSGIRVRTRLTTPVTMAVVLLGAASAADRERNTELLIGGGAFLIVACMLTAHEAIRIGLFRREGVVVRELDLTLTGGSPWLLDHTSSPRREVVTGIGSFIAIAFLASVALLAERIVQTDVPHELAKLVAIAAAGIAVAQTLPALSLDGGRIVRGLFWFLTDDPVSGARGSAIYGSVVAAAVVAAGFMMLGAEEPLPFWGFGVAVAGLQLVTNSTALLRDSAWQRIGGGVTLAGADLPLPARVSITDSLETVVDALIDEGHHAALLVIDETGEPVGVIRLSNLRRVRRSEWAEHGASEVMIPIAAVLTLDPEMSALDALAEIDRSEAAIAVVHTGPGRFILIDRATLLAHLMPRSNTMQQNRAML